MNRRRILTALVVATCLMSMGLHAATVIPANLRAVHLTRELMSGGFSLLDFQRHPTGNGPTAAGGHNRTGSRLELVAILARGETQAVVEAAQRELQRAPTDWRLRMILAHAFEASGRKDEARAQWKGVGGWSAFLALAKSYGLTGQCRVAVDYLDLVDQLAPVTVESALLRGQCNDTLGRPADAARALREALALAPSSVDARMALAHVLSRDPDGVPESRQLLEEALARDSRVYGIYQRLGEVLAQQRDFAASERLYARMVEQFPRHHLPPMYLAQTYQLLGRPDLAEHWFRRSIELDGEYAASRYFLGLLYFGRARSSEPDLKKAIVELSAAARLTGATPRPNEAMFVALADAYVASGDQAEAAKLFCQALRLRPDYAEARVSLMRIRPAGCAP